MKRKITFEFVTVVMLAILAFIIGGFFIAKNNINDITEHNLNEYVQIMAIEYESDPDPIKIINKYEDLKEYLRITFIDSTGVVLVDSSAEELENHSDRPELNNIGTAFIRRSATLDIDMMYLAHEFDDGNYLRVAIPISSILPFVNDFIGLSIIIGIIIVALTIIISQVLINNAMQPLKAVKSILRKVNRGEYSEIMPVRKQDEINDLINEINDINKLIATNILSLTAETEKTDFLLDHMNQGLCILDKDGLIVMLNQYLRRLYHFNIDININKDYRYLFRENDVQESIEKAYNKQTNTNTILKIREGFYSVSISYLEKNWMNQPSVILLFTDVTAIKTIETLKKDFFDNASHELKSPLTSIIGSSDIILQGMATDEVMIKDLTGRISEEAKRMNNLVMDMLTLSKYENQKTLTNKQNIDINTVLKDAVNTLKNLTKTRNINIKTTSKSYYIYADYDEMFQLIKNILENAIKYGKENGQVDINVQRDIDNLIIVIKDDGIGIPKEDQTRIFERFYRVDKARSKSTGGTGLGLSIVKHIVLNYDGHIELDSIENKGTTVSVYIPSKQVKIQ